MKTAIALWLLVAAGIAHAAPLIDEPVAELRLKSGKVYREAIAKTFSPTTVFLKHADGGATIPYEDFPESYQADLQIKRGGTAAERLIAQAKASVDAMEKEAAGEPPAPGAAKPTGPFGLTMGQTIESFGATAKKAKGHTYLVAVPQPHSRFTEYRAVITPKGGLSKIVAYSAGITTSTYGDNLRSAYESTMESLTKKYGRPKRLEYLNHGSIWNEPRDWMTGLLKEERTHCAIWPAAEGGKLPGDMASIIVEAVASDRETGFVKLSYEFKNFDAAIKEIKAAEDESL